MRHLLFFTGPPGSRWSGVSQRIARLPFINLSDLSPHREYEHSEFSGHQGMYFGPGMDLGQGFDRLPELSREEIAAEVDRAFSDPDPSLLRIVKGHVFSYHLPALKEKFPGSRIMVVWREPQACYDWWTRIGAFEIPYPRYGWYRDLPTIRGRIEEECLSIERFARQEGLRLEPFGPEWVKAHFGAEVPFDGDSRTFFDGVLTAVTPA